MTRRRLLTLLLLAFIAGVSEASPNIIFQDNFDSYAAGSFPSSGGWDLSYGGYVDNSQYVSSPNSLKLEGNIYRAAAADHPLAETPDQVIYEVDVKITQPESSVMDYHDATIGLINPAVGSWGTLYGSVTFGPAENRVISPGNIPYNFSQWYHIKVKADMSKRVYDVWVDNQLISSNTTTSIDENYTGIRLEGGNNTHTRVWFDNVKVMRWGVEDTPPVINNVTLDNTTSNTGDAILVTVNATDDVEVTGVKANNASLTKQSGDIWKGTITTLEGTHFVNVSAIDAAGNIAWDNLTSYTATAPDTPSVNLSILINNGAAYTNSTNVTLTLSATGAAEMCFKNESFDWTPWEPFAITKSWILTIGDGLKTVYLKARNNTGEAVPVNDTIILDTSPPSVTNLSISTFTPHRNEPVNITVGVNDTYLNTSSIFVSVKDPKGFTNRSNMAGSGNEIFYYYFNTSEYGRYNVTVSAGDLAGNINSSEKTWFVTGILYANQSINTTANNITRIDALKEVNTTIELATSNDTTGGTISVMMGNDIPPGINRSFDLTPLGKYFSINESKNIKDDLTWIKLKFYYTQAELDASGLDENTLKIAWHNESANRWETLSTGTSQWVNGTGTEITDANGYAGNVWANISHISTFAVMGNPKAIVPTSAPSSGGSPGSSSGGGGGGTSGENYTNVEVKEKYDLDIFKDKLTSYAFTDRNNPILFVNITGNVNAGETTITVEVLRNISFLVNYPAPGKVYKNVNIWVGTSGFAVPKNIKEAVITFRVENSWISSNNLENSDIEMVRWDGSYWSLLKTSQTLKDSTYTYYEAKTYTFLPFAIKGFRKAASAEKPPVTTIQSGASSTTMVTPAATITPAVTVATSAAGAQLINWSIFIVVFAVIGITVAIYLKRKGNFEK